MLSGDIGTGGFESDKWEEEEQQIHNQGPSNCTPMININGKRKIYQHGCTALEYQFIYQYQNFQYRTTQENRLFYQHAPIRYRIPLWFHRHQVLFFHRKI